MQEMGLGMDVGFLVKVDLCADFDIEIADSSYDGMYG